MTRTSYRDAYRDAREEFAELLKERDKTLESLREIEVRIVRMRRGVIALATLAGEEVDDVALGLTESVRALFAHATKPLTTPEVINGIAVLGFDVGTQKNPVASISAVLNRLVETKEVTRQIKNERQPGGTFKSRTYWLGLKVPAVL